MPATTAPFARGPPAPPPLESLPPPRFPLPPDSSWFARARALLLRAPSSRSSSEPLVGFGLSDSAAGLSLEALDPDSPLLFESPAPNGPPFFPAALRGWWATP